MTTPAHSLYHLDVDNFDFSYHQDAGVFSVFHQREQLQQKQQQQQQQQPGAAVNAATSPSTSSFTSSLHSSPSSESSLSSSSSSSSSPLSSNFDFSLDTFLGSAVQNDVQVAAAAQQNVVVAAVEAPSSSSSSSSSSASIFSDALMCPIPSSPQNDFPPSPTLSEGGYQHSLTDFSAGPNSSASGPACNNSCSVCSRTFRRKSNLKRHEEIHKIDKKYKCPKPSCIDRGFRRRDQLASHLRRIHNEILPACATASGHVNTSLQINRLGRSGSLSLVSCKSSIATLSSTSSENSVPIMKRHSFFTPHNTALSPSFDSYIFNDDLSSNLASPNQQQVYRGSLVCTSPTALDASLFSDPDCNISSSIPTTNKNSINSNSTSYSPAPLITERSTLFNQNYSMQGAAVTGSLSADLGIFCDLNLLSSTTPTMSAPLMKTFSTASATQAVTSSSPAMSLFDTILERKYGIGLSSDTLLYQPSF